MIAMIGGGDIDYMGALSAMCFWLEAQGMNVNAIGLCSLFFVLD